MSRRHSLLFGFLVLFLTSLACNAFAPRGTEPEINLPPPDVADLTSTPLPTSESGLAPTATVVGGSEEGGESGGEENENSTDPTVRVLVDLNIRKGPGVQYDRVGFLLAGETAPIIGRDPASGWWKIVCPAKIDDPTECWLSGGSQYSAATNAGGVPVAAVPPTPTPEPTATATATAVPDTNTGNNTNNDGFVVYTTNDGLFQATLDNSQSPPAFGNTAQLAINADIGIIEISPNGQYVVYTTGAAPAFQLRLVNLSTQADTLLLTGADLDDDPSDSIGTFADNIAWLGDSQRILLNTSISNLVGPGAGSREDLYVLTLTGELTQLFGEGEFAGEFAVSGNQLLGGSSDAIRLATIGDNNTTTLIEFPMINTASEYIFYPKPQWISNTSAYVAIPNQSPFEDQQFSIWQLNGATAVQGPDLPGLGLFNSVLWSPNGSRVAFIDNVTEQNTPFITIANGDGQNAFAYDSGDNLQIYEWSNNSQSILYSGNGFYAASAEGGSPTEFLVTDAVLDMQWLGNETFITAVGATGQWNLITNTRSGQTNIVAIVNDDFITFDVWTP